MIVPMQDTRREHKIIVDLVVLMPVKSTNIKICSFIWLMKQISVVNNRYTILKKTEETDRSLIDQNLE
jgi:hypothetical protein